MNMIRKALSTMVIVVAVLLFYIFFKDDIANFFYGAFAQYNGAFR